MGGNAGTVCETLARYDIMYDGIKGNVRREDPLAV